MEKLPKRAEAAVVKEMGDMAAYFEKLEAEEEHRMEMEREERAAQERAEMERHFQSHPHG